jgi:hypothetical protein
MTPVGFEPTIPASGWPQTYTLDRAANGIGLNFWINFVLTWPWPRLLSGIEISVTKPYLHVAALCLELFYCEDGRIAILRNIADSLSV